MFVTYIYFILICVLSLDNVNIANINFRVPNIFNRFGNGVIKYKRCPHNPRPKGYSQKVSPRSFISWTLCLGP